MKSKSLVPAHYPVACHTEHIGPGSTFVAIKGMVTDGMQFVSTAIQKGATSVVVEKGACVPEVATKLIQERGVKLIRVPNARAALADLSAQAADYPAKKLKIIGVTGTKGKTTTAYILNHLLSSAGIKVALLSTVQNKIGEVVEKANLTTAHPDYLHQFFKVALENGVTHVVMEVAAQAHTLHRVDGIEFDGLIFTNFGHEHLEFYTSMTDYFDAKAALFTQLKVGALGIVNADDQACAGLVQQYPEIKMFGLKNNADFVGAVEDFGVQGLNILVLHSGVEHKLFSPTLCGAFNASNILAAVSMAVSLGATFEQCNRGLKTFSHVRGRLEKHELPNGATCYIDYAHNPLSYQSVLPVLKNMTNQLIVVFGAGGERDPARRPKMGKIAAQVADLVVLTNDNPRTEDPQKIISDIKHGIDQHDLNKVVVEPDRKKAIHLAYQCSRKGSIIALLGKGPDEYQIFGDQVVPFSEVEILSHL